MPYIKKTDRTPLEEPIAELAQQLTTMALNEPLATAGLLNYTITSLIMRVTEGTGGIKYHKIATITGMLKNVADEFYRRVATPYENEQINKNGDIPEYNGTR